MKYYVILFSILTFSAITIQADQDRLEQVKNITARFMPDASFRKVKIPGLHEQIVKQRNIWKCVSPGFVNVPTNVTVRRKTITLMIDIGGLMQSIDGGKNWKYISYMSEGGVSGSSFFDFDINPSNSDCIVMGGNRIYRSANGGKTWSESWRGLPPLKYITRGNGYGQVKYNCDGSVLFCAIGSKITMPVGWEKLLKKEYKQKMLFISTNNGDSFKCLKLDTPFSVIKRIYPHPQNANIVYFSFADGSLYVTLNAQADQVRIHALKSPMPGYFVRDMCVNPDNENEMLMTLSSCIKTRAKQSFLYKSLNCMSAEMKAVEFPVKDSTGNKIKCRDLMSCAYNPNQPGQIVLGEGYSPNLFISDNAGKSFRLFSLSDEFYCGGNLGNFYGSMERVYFGDDGTAVAVSKIGCWITNDNFKTVSNLTMKYNNNYFSNYGVGTPANINNISISRNNAFFSAQDHGAWISHCNDYMEWKRLTGNQQWDKFPRQPAPWGGTYTWTHHVEKIFASYDEKYIYINCNALIKKKYKHNFLSDKKFFASYDQGKSWTDVTPRLGRGDVYPEGSFFQKILFDSGDSARHWLLMSDALYFTEDGGKSFVRQESPLFDQIKQENSIRFSDLAYNSLHNILYLSATVKASSIGKKLNHSTAPAALHRSFDKGKSWEIYNIRQNAVSSIAVTDNGTLAVGTQKSGDQPARLIIIPYGQKYNDTMIKLTAGDTPEEVSANQISIGPIVCDGKDILAYSNIAWIHSDRFFAQGPLLSRDNGKSFRWINYNLPCTNIWSLDMKDGKILIGTTFGLMYWRYK